MAAAYIGWLGRASPRRGYLRQHSDIQKLLPVKTRHGDNTFQEDSCPGPMNKMSLVWSRNEKKVEVAGTQQVQGRML